MRKKRNGDVYKQVSVKKGYFVPDTHTRQKQKKRKQLKGVRSASASNHVTPFWLGVSIALARGPHARQHTFMFILF